MGGWDILDRAITIISRLPIEQLITSRSDRHLDRLEQRLKERGLLTPASKTAALVSPVETKPSDNLPDKPRGELFREETIL